MYYIGFDIGGTKCAVSLGERIENGTMLEVLDKVKFPTAGKTPFAVLDLFTDECEKMLEKHSLSYSQIGGIGISCGGPLDAKRGVIMSPPNLPGWDDIHVKEFFEKKTGVKTKLQNDANACAVAEWIFGAGKGCDNMIFLTFGTGLGSGLILDGHLFSGTNDMAGEIGHVRLTDKGPTGYGKEGSCEGYCSGGGIAQTGRAAVIKALEKGERPHLLDVTGSVENINAKIIGDLAEKENDTFCIEIYRKCGEMLGKTLSILVDLLNPQKIVLGGIFMRSAGLLVPEMNRVMKKECLSYALDVCEVVPAGLGEQIGDYAALSLATLAEKE